MANENSFIVIAPEFSSEHYPELGDDYLMGNVYIDGDNPTTESRNPENEWTFSVIEPLFDLMNPYQTRSDSSELRTTYQQKETPSPRSCP